MNDTEPVDDAREILHDHVNELAIGPKDIEGERIRQLHARIDSISDEIERLEE